MYLSHLSCINYRNIRECDLTFSEKFNCFLGDNGMGKTNLLDAIYYLSFTKSHLSAIDSQLINHDGEFFMIQGNYMRNLQEETIMAAVKRRAKKQFKRNKKEYSRLSDHIGLIPAVLVSPDDNYLIQEGSDERRRFMDIVISQYDKDYLHTVMRYNQALQSRNALLKADVMPDAEMLDIYEMQMAHEADYIYKKRCEFVAEFTPLFKDFYSKISGGREEVDLKYTSHNEQGDLKPLLVECRNRDFAIGYTTRGSHKDDLQMLLDGFPIKRTGSQGQNKSYIVAMKLAQYIYLKKATGVSPLLLLDDIFDRLDSSRVENIIKVVSSSDFGQIFITDTNRNYTDSLISKIAAKAAIYTISEGVVSALQPF